VASVAEPSTQDELRPVLRWHAENFHLVTVSGARTGVTGGAVPGESTHLVSVARMPGVPGLDLESTPPTVRVLAGTTLRELQAELSARAARWTLPLEFARDIVARGGCVSAEHGIGRIKKHFLPLQYDAAALAGLRAAKRWLDPPGG
jgi:FAD/FMN-containing dehydrogenase